MGGVIVYIRVSPPSKTHTLLSCQPPSPQKSANCPSFSSLTPSYLLKVTKFLFNISEFNFLVVTEKSIFAYKLFLSLNISDFNLFFMWKLQPPPPTPLKNVTSLFPNNPILKVEVLSSHPLFEKLFFWTILQLWLNGNFSKYYIDQKECVGLTVNQKNWCIWNI